MEHENNKLDMKLGITTNRRNTRISVHTILYKNNHPHYDAVIVWYKTLIKRDALTRESWG